jgi:hypothetical protein
MRIWWRRLANARWWPWTSPSALPNAVPAPAITTPAVSWGAAPAASSPRRCGPLLALSDYAEANRVARNLQKRGISKQGWAIVHARSSPPTSATRPCSPFRAAQKKTTPSKPSLHWTAERILEGRARELGDAHIDQTGLPMRIVY